MDTIHLNIRQALGFVSEQDLQSLKPEVATAKKHLLEGDAAGNDFIGWVNLPEEIDGEMLARLKRITQNQLKFLATEW